MIAWGDVYKLVVAMVPLYLALGLGYGSVKWWKMFKSDHCDAINRFNCYFVLPFFTMKFTCGVNPYRMNYRFLAGDVVAKSIVGLVLALWANLSKNGEFSWAITSFSLSSLNNTLVVGVPLLNAMYGVLGEDLVVQSYVIQSLLWFPILLFMLELWRTIRICYVDNDRDMSSVVDDQKITIDNENNNYIREFDSVVENRISTSFSFGSTMKKVWGKLAKNPNMSACAIGLIWALVAKRWDLEMPSIVEGSIQIMAKAGSGVSMFSIGLFMALQEKVIACGVRLTIYNMILRFIFGPLTMAIGSFALGLRGNTLRIAIIQAALPQAISAFVFAQEYGLHADVLSSAVIFGTIISLPLLIGYYLVLDAIH